MKNKNIIGGLGLLIMCLAFSNTQAQNAGKLGVGVRLGGYTSGVSAKYFLQENVALEGILGTSFGRRGVQLTGLYELHADAFGLNGLQWYYGAGAHIGSFEGRHYYHPSHKHYYDSYERQLATVGIDGIVGLEYQITEIPISLGLDFKPFIDVNRYGVFLFGDGALTVRYTF